MERVRFAGGGGLVLDQETLKLTRCGCVPQVSLGRIGAPSNLGCSVSIYIGL